MARRRDDQLFEMLRARGLRKRAARVVSEASTAGRGASGQLEKRARGVIKDLRGLADELEDRVSGGPAKRKAAAKKAATTRKAKARKRSQAAKKAAATRARAAGNGRRTG